MSYYFMAGIIIKDKEEYKRYLDGADEDFEAWYRSDDYQAILKHRLKGSESNTILIRGKE